MSSEIIPMNSNNNNNTMTKTLVNTTNPMASGDTLDEKDGIQGGCLHGKSIHAAQTNDSSICVITSNHDDLMNSNTTNDRINKSSIQQQPQPQPQQHSNSSMQHQIMKNQFTENISNTFLSDTDDHAETNNCCYATTSKLFDSDSNNNNNDMNTIPICLNISNSPCCLQTTDAMNSNAMICKFVEKEKQLIIEQQTIPRTFDQSSGIFCSNNNNNNTNKNLSLCPLNTDRSSSSNGSCNDYFGHAYPSSTTTTTNHLNTTTTSTTTLTTTPTTSTTDTSSSMTPTKSTTMIDLKTNHQISMIYDQHPTAAVNDAPRCDYLNDVSSYNDSNNNNNNSGYIDNTVSFDVYHINSSCTTTSSSNNNSLLKQQTNENFVKKNGIKSQESCSATTTSTTATVTTIPLNAVIQSNVIESPSPHHQRQKQLHHDHRTYMSPSCSTDSSYLFSQCLNILTNRKSVTTTTATTTTTAATTTTTTINITNNNSIPTSPSTTTTTDNKNDTTSRDHNKLNGSDLTHSSLHPSTSIGNNLRNRNLTTENNVSSHNNNNNNNTNSNNTNTNHDKTNLIINYLPPYMSQEEVKLLFSTCGKIESCKLIREKSTGESLGYAFVKYSHPNEAQHAIRTLNGLSIQNKTIKVSLARPKCESIKGANLYVSGLPKTMTQNELEQLFSQYGRIITARILYDNKTGISRGVAFVRFDHRYEAELAIQQLNGYQLPTDYYSNNLLLNKPITVKFANSPSLMKLDNLSLVLLKKVAQLQAVATSTMNSSASSAAAAAAAAAAAPGTTGTAGAASSSAATASSSSRSATKAAIDTALFNPLQQQIAKISNLLKYSITSPSSNETNFFSSMAAASTAAMSNSILAPAIVASSGGLTPNGWCIFVYNLAPEIEESHLWQLFGPFGAVQTIKIIYDTINNKCKGFAFVTMSNYDEAVLAIHSLNGFILNNRILQVSFKTTNNKSRSFTLNNNNASSSLSSASSLSSSTSASASASSSSSTSASTSSLNQSSSLPSDTLTNLSHLHQTSSNFSLKSKKNLTK